VTYFISCHKVNDVCFIIILLFSKVVKLHSLFKSVVFHLRHKVI